ncbi:MAG: hypothetical protein DHS20C06_19610 [Hyphobacterium sp.]|nr:MAG: hypothetical protein DHS20C06_19610 [Hyphobacterium sp.]
MNMLWIWTCFIRPALAFLVASTAAAFTITLSFYVTSVFGEGADPITGEGLAAMLAVTLLTGAYVAAFAAFPVFILIWILRGLTLRRGWTDAITGAILGALLIHLMAFGLSGLTTLPSLLSLLFGAAGLIAGFAYWFLAGRPRPPYAAKQA